MYECESIDSLFKYLVLSREASLFVISGRHAHRKLGRRQPPFWLKVMHVKIYTWLVFWLGFFLVQQRYTCTRSYE